MGLERRFDGYDWLGGGLLVYIPFMIMIYDI
jgi:hypothetical protein